MPNSVLVWQFERLFHLSVPLVCLFVRWHVLRTTYENFLRFLCMLSADVVRSSTGDVTISYVLLVLWMMYSLVVLAQAKTTLVERLLKVTHHTAAPNRGRCLLSTIALLVYVVYRTSGQRILPRGRITCRWIFHWVNLMWHPLFKFFKRI